MGRESRRKAENRVAKGKMWKIDLRPYDVEVASIGDDGRVEMENGKPVMVKDDFDVKGSMASILFNQELKLNVDETFQAKDLADKIRGSNSSVLVDGAELGKLQAAYKIIKGIPEQQLEFFRRIRDAEEVEVEEAKIAD